MLKMLYRLDLPIQDLVDQHITRFPVGGIFTPEKTAINPFQLLSGEQELGLVNIYFTLSPDERDGRVLWNFFDRALGELSEELQQLSFRTRYGGKTEWSRLRSAVWSLGSPDSSSFRILGLTDNPNIRLPVSDVAIIQVKGAWKNELMANLGEYTGGKDGYQVIPVASAQAFDEILRESKTTPLFESLIPLREKFHTLGTEGVVQYLARRIRMEEGIMRMEQTLDGKDPSSLSEEEQEKALQEFFGSKGKEF